MSFLPLFGCFHKSKQSGANLQGDSINPPANFPHDMVHVNGLSARHSSKSNRSVNDDFALFSQKHRFSSVLVDFMVDFFASTAASTARWAGRHKTKKARQPSDCQAFSSVGVTGGENRFFRFSLYPLWIRCNPTTNISLLFSCIYLRYSCSCFGPTFSKGLIISPFIKVGPNNYCVIIDSYLF